VLKLRRGIVAGIDPLEVEVDGERRRAWADAALIGPCEEGDEVVVNVAALDLGLGSGGFDIVHVNLTRGLAGGATEPGVHVMKLNYLSLQHAVEPLEERVEGRQAPADPMPALVIPLHGHLAPAAWAAAGVWAERGGERPLRIGFVQGGGGALTGSLSRDVVALRDRGLLSGSIAVAPCFGAEEEAISLPGALHAAATALSWDAAIVGPGPGILGSATRFGHGGMAALEAAHAALALGLPTLLSPRLSAADPRPRHRGLSHHTASVLQLLLAGVEVAVPEDAETLWPAGEDDEEGTRVLELAAGPPHSLRRAPAALGAYAESGLPRRTMGRDLDEDRLFFAGPLAAGSLLAEAVAERSG
jgi:hypothetical protein